MRHVLFQVLTDNPVLRGKIEAGIDTARLFQELGVESEGLSKATMDVLHVATLLNRGEMCALMLALAEYLAEQAERGGDSERPELITARKNILRQCCWLPSAHRLAIIAELALFERFCAPPRQGESHD